MPDRRWVFLEGFLAFLALFVTQDHPWLFLVALLALCDAFLGAGQLLIPKRHEPGVTAPK